MSGQKEEVPVSIEEGRNEEKCSKEAQEELMFR